MKKFKWILFGVVLTQTACDLQPKILSLPDSVGDFISARYPALLADPNTQPEIYNSAASDYGIYAAPDLYGHESVDDYVMYASVDDYIVPPQTEQSLYGSEFIASQYGQEPAEKTDVLMVPEYTPNKTDVPADDNKIVVVRGDTLYSLARKNNMSVEELAKLNNLSAPYQLSVGQTLTLKSAEVSPADVLTVNKPVVGVRTATRVNLQDVKVVAGDTLYSLSRKYSVPVNDLAVMNNIKPPFTLSVGQVIRVPDLNSAPVASVQKTEPQKIAGKQETSVKVKQHTPVKKISSDPTKKLPTIGARSSTKFSWPVRGRILSEYGAKSNGLFNDGINIAASKGTTVKAAENGVVAYAGNEVKGMGNLIIVQHDSGWMSVYAHMDSMNVKRGTKVSVGQKIGTVGETGKVDRPQLHFEIRKGTKAYNPVAHLKK